MKKLLALFAVALCVSSSAFAINGSWSKTTLHYTIYLSGGYATMPFSPPSSVPISGTSITSVTYNWSPYPNGNTTETVQLCYSKPYSSTLERCQDVSSLQSGSRNEFNGLSARGSFWIRHTLTGGTYPATASGMSDTVTVNYTY